jgi:hypothetical protein
MLHFFTAETRRASRKHQMRQCTEQLKGANAVALTSRGPGSGMGTLRTEKVSEGGGAMRQFLWENNRGFELQLQPLEGSKQQASIMGTLAAAGF